MEHDVLLTFFFFFQAEDGIRDYKVTGVQTCALPISVVPIEITSNVPGTTSIAVLIDKNPFPLVGKFDFTAGALPFVKLNAKMGETSEVRVIAEAGGRHYVATQEIKVTIGGCGGEARNGTMGGGPREKRAADNGGGNGRPGGA